MFHHLQVVVVVVVELLHILLGVLQLQQDKILVELTTMQAVVVAVERLIQQVQPAVALVVAVLVAMVVLHHLHLLLEQQTQVVAVAVLVQIILLALVLTVVQVL
jgi:hypothetical protein